MVWGAFCKGSKYPLVFIENTVDSNGYIDILQDHMLSWAEATFASSSSGWRFQQDGAGVHRANAVHEWFF